MLSWLHGGQGQPEPCSKPFLKTTAIWIEYKKNKQKSHPCMRILGVGLSNLYFVLHIPLIVINPKFEGTRIDIPYQLSCVMKVQGLHQSSFHQIDTFLCHSSRTSLLSAARSWLWCNGHRGCYQSVISYESLAFFFYSYMSLANFYVPPICLPFLKETFDGERIIIIWHFHFYEETCREMNTSALGQLTHLWYE